LNDPASIADEILACLATSGSRDYIGEPVSQLEHALQAAHCATEAGADEEVVLAALLHDVGHLVAPAGTPSMDGLGADRHDWHGSQYVLAHGLSERVAALIRGHVEAKRYLVSQTPGYLERLSAASRSTLDWQGGPMGSAEAMHFRTDSLFKDKLRIRAWDEAAKEKGLAVPGLEAYREMLIRHLSARAMPAARGRPEGGDASDFQRG